MQRSIHPLAVLLLLLTLFISPYSSSAQQANPDDSSKVDLRLLEKQMLGEVNRLRTDPQTTVNNLNAMVQNRREHRNGLTMTLPDTTTHTISKRYYIDTAISTARSQQIVQPLIWSEGLARAAGDYANRNPKGHRDFGTTLGSRTAVFGVSADGVGENINYGGASALNQIYSLFIDDGVPDFGHRLSLISPKWTHIGIGCYYPNSYKDITCVVNYGANWTELDDMVKLEVGKQYAFREKNNTFRYFKLTSTNQRGAFPIRIDVCPEMLGSISMPDSGGLTTVEAAQAEGLVATNEPCDTNSTPHGVLNNGTALPITPQELEAIPPVPPLAVPGGESAPAPTAAPTTAPTAAAPTAAPITAAPTAAPTTAAATAAPTTAPAAPAGAGQPGQPEVGKQYAVRTQGDKFNYFLLTEIKPRANGGTDYIVQLCPEPGKLGGGTVANTTDLLTPEEAQAQGLTALNQPCGQDVAPFGGSVQPVPTAAPTSAPTTTPTAAPAAPAGAGQPGQPEVGKQYAVRTQGDKFNYFLLTEIKPRANGGTDYIVQLCPEPGKLGGGTVANTTDLLTPEEAQAQGLTALNQPCGQDVAPFGASVQPAPATAPTAAPTAAPAAAPTTAPIELQIGEMYAIPDANNTFRYATLVQYRASTTSSSAGESGSMTVHSFATCPKRGPEWDFQIFNHYKNTNSAVMTTEMALAAGLTATNEPCISVPSITGSLQIGHQYAIRGDKDNTFSYAQLRTIRNGIGTFDYCPSPGSMSSVAVANKKNIVTVSAALAANLKPKNQPCSTDAAPHGN